MTNPILQSIGLKKTYAGLDVAVLNGIDLDVQAGEQVAIVGTSGSGKSTLLHLLGGLDAPSEGQVSILGKPLAEMNETKRGELRNQSLGFVYQFHHLLPEFTALENVAMPLLIRRTPREEAMASAAEILKKVGLAHRLEHMPGELSGGERQRAALARALVTRPQCVLADEPTGNLDSKTSYEIMDLFDQLHKKGNTIVMVTHEDDIAQYAHRIIRLRDGLIESDTINTNVRKVEKS
jgi:lipoprotein-releasing system ATP-binding protein